MKESVYEIIQRNVHEGKKCIVNLEKKFIKLGTKYAYMPGFVPHDWGIPEMTLEETLMEIERLYDRYRHSIPSERSESRRRKYFYALPVDELEDDDLHFGEPRDVAQAALESFVLLSTVVGNLKWDEEKMGKWFWHSKVHPDLIILRKWVE